VYFIQNVLSLVGDMEKMMCDSIKSNIKQQNSKDGHTTREGFSVCDLPSWRVNEDYDK
jgi:hypothetical protein